MRAASFELDDRATYGVVRDGHLTEASDGFRETFPDLRAVLEAQAIGALDADAGGDVRAVDDVDFLPPIPNPDKVLCIGVNYRPHIEEMGRGVPDRPVVFVRFSGSQTGHGRPVVRPQISEQFDFEGELAVVIGRRARHVQRAQALQYVAGYCCFMDGSVRDWQWHSSQFTAGKNFHESGAMGPYLVTADEIPDPSALTLCTYVNGELVQQGSTRELIFDVPYLIEYCSSFAELLPGDVIATGTPGGVGAARKPPLWLRHGDRVEVEISGVGRLQNPVLDE
jgi:2-keto-4-pentenoate hydratase/2-oxohepta-3-ene-1,7-dioic acid hydratase in catechol pathway